MLVYGKLTRDIESHKDYTFNNFLSGRKNAVCIITIQCTLCI